MIHDGKTKPLEVSLCISGQTRSRNADSHKGRVTTSILLIEEMSFDVSLALNNTLGMILNYDLFSLLPKIPLIRPKIAIPKDSFFKSIGLVILFWIVFFTII